ncbi:MAG: ABC transporter permease [Spartobacteria bacterium]|nr:ABC transporter permease [Spartobacteria bacterium]
MILDKKLLRDIIRLRGMIAAVVSIIAVGTASYVGMLATYNNLNHAKIRYYSQCRMADFWVDLKKAPNTEVAQLLDIPGISELRTRISFPVVVDLEGVDKPISGVAISMPVEPEPVINNIVMRQGSYFTAERRNEVIVSEPFAKARNVRPGTFIHLVLNGQRKELFVVGTAISSEHIYLAPPGGIVDNPMEYGAFFLKQDYAEDMFGFNGAYNNLVGLLTPEARANHEYVFEELNRQLSDYGVFMITPLSLQFSNLTLSSEMGGLQSMATMFPILFLSVAALILNVLMTRLAEQQRTIVGTLKALGYKNRQVLDHFIKFGLLVGVAGGVAGCLLGYWISGGMTTMYSAVFEFPQLSNAVYPATMFTAMAISIFFAVLGTIRGVKQVVHLNPAEAMREPAPPVGGSILLERFPRFWNSLDFRWQIVMRGFFRNKVRTLISIFAAALGAAMVAMAFGFVNSMNAMINFQFDNVMLSDYNITLRDELNSASALDAALLPGVSRVEPVFNVACTFEHLNHHKKGVITGIKHDATLTVPCRKDGQPVQVPAAGLLMTERLAEQLHVKAGDEITFVPVKGNRDRYTVPIVKTIRSMIGLGVYADYTYLNHLIGEADAVSELQLKTEQTTSQRDAFFLALKRYPNVQSVGDVNTQKVVMAKQFNGAMLGMAIGMIVFAGVIFFGSILNGSLISISERQREIATFRVLGYQPREVSEIFFRENMVTNLIGTVFGLPLGYVLLYGMMTQFTNDAYSMPAVLSPISYLWTAVLAVLFVLGAQWVIHRSILKLVWQEALSMKE